MKLFLLLLFKLNSYESNLNKFVSFNIHVIVLLII